VGLTHLSIGTVQSELGHLDAALDSLSAARSVFSKASDRDKHLHSAATATNAAASVRRQQGRLEEALALHRDALGQLVHALGRDHADVADTHKHIAGVCLAMGRREEASEMYDASFEIFAKTLEDTSPSGILAWQNHRSTWLQTHSAPHKPPSPPSCPPSTSLPSSAGASTGGSRVVPHSIFTGADMFLLSSDAKRRGSVSACTERFRSLAFKVCHCINDEHKGAA